MLRDDPKDIARITAALNAYAEAIAPWAQATAARMIDDVAKRDELDWAKQGREMSRSLRQEILSAPTGIIRAKLLAEQVALITSLPTEAAERAQRLAAETVLSGDRFASIVEEINRSGEVTESRARLIARTEVARQPCDDHAKPCAACWQSGLHMAHVARQPCAPAAQEAGRLIADVGCSAD